MCWGRARSEGSATNQNHRNAHTNACTLNCKRTPHIVPHVQTWGRSSASLHHMCRRGGDLVRLCTLTVQWTILGVMRCPVCACRQMHKGHSSYFMRTTLLCQLCPNTCAGASCHLKWRRKWMSWSHCEKYVRRNCHLSVGSYLRATPC